MMMIMMIKLLLAVLVNRRQRSSVSSHSRWLHFRSEITSTVNSLNYVGGRTSSSDALRLLRTDLFTVRLGARASVPHVAVLITDGDIDNLQQTIDEVFDFA